jgi:hypothetical protein
MVARFPTIVEDDTDILHEGEPLTDRVLGTYSDIVQFFIFTHLLDYSLSLEQDCPDCHF